MTDYKMNHRPIEEHNAESTSSNNLLCPESHGNMLSTGIRLITATEAAQVLHVSRNAIYTLWRKGLLDFWSINGTRTTNLRAIGDFLERTRNTELQIEKEEA